MRLLILLISLLTFNSILAQNSYRFLVAGHVYGAAGVNNAAFHPPFQTTLDSLSASKSLDFGFFTGDIVSPNPTAQDWDEVDSVLNLIDFPIDFVAGNHDYENIEEYTARYGDTYYMKKYGNDLFIVLDANISNWNIADEQLDSVQSYLNNYPEVDNIFCFVHQIIWYEPDGKHSKHTPNSLVGFQDSTNFWSELIPLFGNTAKPCYFFAGDVGVFDFTTSIAYQRFSNIHLICSGMGGAQDENCILVSVNENKLVEFDVICLNADATNCPNDIRKLLPLTGNIVFPNPVTDELVIEIDHSKQTSIQLYDSNGKSLFDGLFSDVTLAKINVSTLQSGTYILVISDGEHLSRETVVVTH